MGSRSGLFRSSIAAFVLAFLSFTAASASVRRGPPPAVPPQVVASLNARPQYVVMLVLDGALPSYFRLADFPHLAALIRSGTRYVRAWDGMLESETPTGHATLGTGSLPRRHGVISFGWVTDKNIPEQPTNPIPIQQGQLEQLLRQSGVPSIASLVKQHSPNARVVVTSGHKDYAVDAVGGWAADYMMYYAVQNQIWTPIAIPRHVPPASIMRAPGLSTYAPHLYPGQQDSLAVKLAMTAFQQIHQTVTIVNLPEFDWPLGHLQGGAADRWLAWKLMSQLDADVASIESTLASEHALKKTLFVITADHGMITLKHLIPHDEIEKAVAAAGTSLSDYEFHTAGYLWLRNRTKAAAVTEKVMALRNPYILGVYYRNAAGHPYTLAPGSTRITASLDAAYRYLLSTFANPDSPQLMIALAEGTGIRGRNQTGWHGDHGGPSWQAEHIPLVLSGPGIRTGYVSDYPATLYDVAPTVLSLLGIVPRGMDGIVLDDGLTAPDPALARAQQGRGAQLVPLQAALMAESRRDH